MIKNHDFYKSSGVAWLGDIPEHWTTKKLKYLCEITTGDCDTNMAEPDGEFDLFVRAQKVLKINKYTHECEAVLTAGDGVGVGKVFHYTTGKFSFHQRVYMMSNFKLVIGQYFFYYLSNLFARVALDGGAKSTVDSLRLPTFVNFVFALPNKKEQIAIVRYLDNETARIDDLISEKQNFIKLLEEKRQALISHVVTKGLDDNVKMKDSGVEWIGEVPELWETKRFRYMFRFGRGLSITKENLKDSGIKVVNYGEIHSKFNFELDTTRDELKFVDESYLDSSPECIIGKGDFVFADTSEDYDGSGNFTHLISDEKIFAGYHTVVCRIVGENDTRFVSYFLDSLAFRSQIRSVIKGVKVYSISQRILKNTFLAVPNIEEQREIAQFLDKQTYKLKLLSDETKITIKLLKERRSALISAAVTGKIDIRDEV
tara:strand:- start:11039 stop:12322 length:1284 start_codon:yes stop_codon:yes gene_type:complete